MPATIARIRASVTNTYLIRDHGAILIDPGMAGRGERVARALAKLLDEPRSVRLIVITHGHFDHIGAAAALREALRAPVAIHAADARWLREGVAAWPRALTCWGKVMRSVGIRVLPHLRAIPALEPDVLLGDDGLDLEPYGVSGKIVHTPGHSAGSVSVLLESGDAFVGDLAMNGFPMCLHPSFGIFAHDPELVPHSWRRLVALGATTIYPAHGRPFPATALAGAA